MIKYADLDYKGKRTIIRVDFNVPIEGSAITDDSRIVAALPTIEYVRNKGGKVILMSHLGRPDGKVMPEFSLKPVKYKLEELLKLPKDAVKMAPDCIGKDVGYIINNMKEGDIILLENLRFHPEEEADDHVFAEKLTELADIYINDAFGTAHRRHASTYGIVEIMKEQGKKVAAGYLMLEEIKMLTPLLTPKGNSVAIIGGLKVSDKIGIINTLVGMYDSVLIGGAMANTFLKSDGKDIGGSSFENDYVETVKTLLKSYKNKILIPVDVVTGIVPRIIKEGKEKKDYKKAKYSGEVDFSAGGAINKAEDALDIHKKTIALYKSVIAKANTVFWNGPIGVFEVKEFANGTMEIAKAVAANKGYTVIGGGDSVAALEKSGLKEKIKWVSTGGGASLEFLEKKGHLPGIDVLE